MPELSITEIEDDLRLLPKQVHDAGVEVVKATKALDLIQNQIEIDKAKERIEHAHEDFLSAKMVESYATIATKELTAQLVELKNELEVKKLAHKLLDDKLLSVKKIANLRNIYNA